MSELFEVILGLRSFNHPNTTPSSSRWRRPELQAGRWLQRGRISERHDAVRIYFWHKSDALPKLTASKVKESIKQSVVSVSDLLEVTSTEHSSLLRSSQWWHAPLLIRPRNEEGVRAHGGRWKVGYRS